MEFAFTPAHEQFRAELRDFCRAEVTADLFRELREAGDEHHPGFYRKLADRGWIGLPWPAEYGGRALDTLHAAIFFEEMEYAFAPLGRYRGSVIFVGQSILAFGNEEQKREFLPRIARGEVTCCWLLSEPNAGSDAAAIQLRAEEDGDDYVLNGQKIFTSGAHAADYGMVAARTDSRAPSKYAGISLFLVPMRNPGLTIRPLWTIGGWRINQEFFDDVRVPRTAMLGEKNAGWQNMTRYTLNFERAAIAKTGTLLRLSDELMEFLRGARSTAGTRMRHRLAELSAEIAACRWLGYKVAWLYDQGLTPTSESSMIKVLTADLLYKLADLGSDILGYAGVARGREAPLEGRIELMLRSIWFHLVGGGAPDIQRNIIALRGLGLPKGPV